MICNWLQEADLFLKRNQRLCKSDTNHAGRTMGTKTLTDIDNGKNEVHNLVSRCTSVDQNLKVK